MHHHYNDIRSRIAEPPAWFDEHAVPRYGDFTPRDGANIYAEQVALVLISCQQCETQFKVCFSWNKFDEMRGCPPLWESIKDGSLHFGDPPNIQCCSGGNTMNCNDLQVLEAWERGTPDNLWKWGRLPQYEILLPDHEDYEDPTP